MATCSSEEEARGYVIEMSEMERSPDGTEFFRFTFQISENLHETKRVACFRPDLRCSFETNMKKGWCLRGMEKDGIYGLKITTNTEVTFVDLDFPVVADFLSEPIEHEISGYVFYVTDTRYSKDGGCQFFTFDYQVSDTDFKKVICFEPHLRATFLDHDIHRLGIRLCPVEILMDEKIKVGSRTSVSTRTLNFGRKDKLEKREVEGYVFNVGEARSANYRENCNFFNFYLQVNETDFSDAVCFVPELREEYASYHVDKIGVRLCPVTWDNRGFQVDSRTETTMIDLNFARKIRNTDKEIRGRVGWVTEIKEAAYNPNCVYFNFQIQVKGGNVKNGVCFEPKYFSDFQMAEQEGETLGLCPVTFGGDGDVKVNSTTEISYPDA